MKKQHFYIFYSENDENEIPVKLVKTYMNNFCIDEEYQSEVIEIHPLKEIRKIFKADISNIS